MENDRKKNSPCASNATYTANQVQHVLQQELPSILQQQLEPSDPPAVVPPAAQPPSANAGVSANNVRRIFTEALASHSSPRLSARNQVNRSIDNSERPLHPPIVAQGFLNGKLLLFAWYH